MRGDLSDAPEGWYISWYVFIPDRHQQVTADLGRTFLKAPVDAVDSARDDFVAFRQWRPAWFSTFTNRFTSNFIHERIWAHLIAGLDDDSDLVVTDKEPRRDTSCRWRPVVVDQALLLRPDQDLPDIIGD